MTLAATSADRPVGVDDLSVDQREVYDLVIGWVTGGVGGFSSSKLLTLGGVAGSGKSTLVGVLAREFERRKMTVAYAALTGRASSILGRKLAAAGAKVTDKIRPDDRAAARGQLGLFDASLKEHGGPAFCGTLHRLLYRPLINDREELLGWRKRDALDRKYDLLVVDEASMISREVLADLEDHSTPILAVGDHGQLPPVASSGSVVDDPDLRLEKIHRQAEGNPIIALADFIRRRGSVVSQFEDGKRVILGKRTDVGAWLRKTRSAGLRRGVVCHRNATRVWLNGLARDAAGLEGEPKAGEVVLCLRNAAPIFNGMRGVLDTDSVLDDAEPWILNARVGFPEEGLAPEDLYLCAPQFNRPEVFRELKELHGLGIRANAMSEGGLLFDFGYALTAHKAQGSEFDTCIVYLDRREDPSSEDWRRWMYTAATRSKRRLVVLR